MDTFQAKFTFISIYNRYTLTLHPAIPDAAIDTNITIIASVAQNIQVPLVITVINAADLFTK